MYTIITECLLYYGKCLCSDSINIVEAVYIMPWDNVKAHNSTECRQSVYIMMALVLIIYEGTCLLCAIKRLCLLNEVVPSIYLMKPSQNSLTASYVRPCIFWRLWKWSWNVLWSIWLFHFVLYRWTHSRISEDRPGWAEGATDPVIKWVRKLPWNQKSGCQNLHFH